MVTEKEKWNWKKIGTVILLISLLTVLTTWLALTPPGVDGKTRAVGYAVCHQIEDHTLMIGGNLLPLCARCTGTFLGLLITTSYLLTSGRRGGFPSKIKATALILLAVWFTVDGINSTLSLLTGSGPLYEPANTLRLATGLGFGIALGNLITPLWNQTLWTESDPLPTLINWRQLIVLFLLAAITGSLILLDIPFLFYPIAILSTLSILLVLAMVYSLLWCIILKRENTLQHWRDGIRIFSAGLLTAIIQVGLIDLFRFLATGTWASLQL